MTLEKALELAEEMAKERGRDCIEDEMIQVFASSIKLVQSHAKSAMDKLPERWNMGFQAGLKQAIPYEKELTDALAAERKARQDDNAALTADNLKLEEELRCIKTTIQTFLHDLDNVPTDNKPGVLMSSFMWMQVEAFRRLVSR